MSKKKFPKCYTSDWIPQILLGWAMSTFMLLASFDNFRWHVITWMSSIKMNTWKNQHLHGNMHYYERELFIFLSTVFFHAYLFTLATAGQVSLRTVSIPLASNTGSFWSRLSYMYPTYLFLVCNTQGKYTCTGPMGKSYCKWRLKCTSYILHYYSESVSSRVQSLYYWCHSALIVTPLKRFEFLLQLLKQKHPNISLHGRTS